MKLHYVRRRIFALMCLSIVLTVSTARANEIWVAPTLQTDTGGLGVGNGIWPVSPLGVTRLVVAVPDDLQTFQSAKVVLIPKAPAGAGVLHLFVCTAENSDMVGATCSGPIDRAFTGVVNQLIEVDVSTALAPSVTGPGVQYLAVAAYTTPTFTTDHIVGLRFAYAPTPPTGVATLGGNTFTGTQTAPAFAGDGSALSNVSANLLDGIDSTAFALAIHGHDVSQVTNAARLSGGNTFTGVQTIDSGNLDLDPSTAATGNVTKNGALFLHNLGSDNTFLGLNAGNGTLTGTRNTVVGENAMTNATSASFNTAGGASALRNITVGGNNTAYGLEALFSTTSGSSNTAMGAGALHSSTTANANTAVGSLALWANTTGIENTAVGIFALNNNTSGANNTAVGKGSLLANTVGIHNAALGTDALGSTTGSLNLGLGYSAGTNNTSGSNNIYLGASVAGVAGESNTMYLGKVGTQTKTVIAGVRGTAVTGGEMVVIDASGRLGSTAAALTPGANSVGTNEVINDSLTQDDLGPDSVGASEVAFNYAGSASEGGSATNADLLDGIDSSAFASAAHGHDVSQVTNAAKLAGGNTLTGLQTLDAGNLDLDDSTAATGNLMKSGLRFLHNFGASNVFVGRNAGNFTMDASASGNSTLGFNTLLANTFGVNNSAVGGAALMLNSTGAHNTAMGSSSLLENSSGHHNVAVGAAAGQNGTTGAFNIYLGAAVDGIAGESNTMYLGRVGTQTKTLIAGVRGITTGIANAIPVVIDSAGQLGTVSSSRRFKEDIQDMPTSLADRLLKLRPVTFRYTRPYADGSKPIQYGLVAEEVAGVFPELAVRNADGDVETVHYETLNVLLLRQFQEQQRELDQLKQQVRALIEAQTNR